jgi:4-amino-4-deoxy-L-arabinose transferase-like glycosyltransferase
MDRRPRAERALPRVAARVILMTAVIVGAWLRFHDLGQRELSADEGATWAAAAAPSPSEVVRLQALFNPGKLPVHELLLHFWMANFSDSAVAMRALSALLGTLAIALVFIVAREIFKEEREGGGELIAAAGAMIFAVSLVTIKYSREARMYPLLLCATLVQVWFFVRVSRRPVSGELIALTIFTAVILATHFTSAFLVAAQGLWLIWSVLWRGSNLKAASLAAAGLIAGLVLLGPTLPSAIRSSASAVNSGAVDWIPRPTLWEPLAILNKASGSIAFPIIAGLAIFGAVRRWNHGAETVQFLLAWLWLPMILELGVSYALKPLLLERYVLGCFVPFMILAGAGILEVAALKTARGAPRYDHLLALLAVASAVSIGHLVAYQGKFHDAQWREATSAAIASANDNVIAVAPGYACNVVRFYAPSQARARIVPASNDHSADKGAKVLIVSDQGMTDALRNEIEGEYPSVIDQFRGLQLRKP